MKQEISTKKICEACNAEFSCGAESEKCWCFEIALSAETLAKLQEDFKSCLCQKCLLSHERTSTNTKKH